jgi:hypothetical protein
MSHFKLHSQNFQKEFDWVGYNSEFTSQMAGHRIALATPLPHPYLISVLILIHSAKVRHFRCGLRMRGGLFRHNFIGSLEERMSEYRPLSLMTWALVS